MLTPKILVVFYSRTGFTRRIAKEIAEACGADVEEVRDVRSRRGPLGFLRSGYEASTRKRAKIKDTTFDPAQYDLVVIGTPVWAGNVASPIRAYVAAQHDRLTAVALFCTMGGQNPSRTLPELAELCGVEPAATVAVSAKEIKADHYRNEIAEFVRAVTETMRAEAA
jgi:flavodoxin